VLPVHNVPVVHVGFDLAGEFDAAAAHGRDPREPRPHGSRRQSRGMRSPSAWQRRSRLCPIAAAGRAIAAAVAPGGWRK